MVLVAVLGLYSTRRLPSGACGQVNTRGLANVHAHQESTYLPTGLELHYSLKSMQKLLDSRLPVIEVERWSYSNIGAPCSEAYVPACPLHGEWGYGRVELLYLDEGST